MAMSVRAHSLRTPLLRASKNSRRFVCHASRSPSEPHLQLGTAALVSSTDVPSFGKYMYQWASTLTQNGVNMPFALPLRVDKLPTGFQVSLLKTTTISEDGGIMPSVADIVGTVEPVDGVGNVFFVRFYEGSAASEDRVTPLPSDPNARLETIIQSLVDVPLICNSMPAAIGTAMRACSTTA